MKVRPHDRLRVIVGVGLAVRPVRIEPDRELDERNRFCQPAALAASCSSFVPFRPLAGRYALHLHRPSNFGVVGRQRVVRDPRRPPGRERIAFLPSRNVRVNRRSAAPRRRLDDRHVRKHAQAEPAAASPARRIEPTDPRASAGSAPPSIRARARAPAPMRRLRQSARRDGAAKPEPMTMTSASAMGARPRESRRTRRSACQGTGP